MKPTLSLQDFLHVTVKPELGSLPGILKLKGKLRSENSYISACPNRALYMYIGRRRCTTSDNRGFGICRHQSKTRPRPMSMVYSGGFPFQ